MEKLLQTLPRHTATSIRAKEPGTSKEAVRLAQYYFQDRNTDPDDPKWMRRGDGGDYRRSQRDQFSRRYHGENFERYQGEQFDRGRRYGDDRSQQERNGDNPRKDTREQYRHENAERGKEARRDEQKPLETKHYGR